ncbi:methyl-accepting chemotaxis protein [Candidatus Venteria ishoeyi]|uniref:Methyl-accepting chemotaxis protein McpB n=1 Tax=Candidatus Venteria ishoeyi TaxID=1899563 RepID=A0A1H6FA32_9GAMM|nr:methyl-accepting chemotaxis protein [Candidatus Venteria ishoeyi]MDM8547280.1 methyl-accepting chemotaxis protein [Candidatus Venteria ishoeyi]SEH06473.1 Methyl-accepting chemotaxis protein McpB [Candidatus Venteria ishoeyi]
MKLSKKFFIPAGIFSAVVIGMFIFLALAFKSQTQSLQAFYSSHLSVEKEVFKLANRFTEAHTVISELIVRNMMGDTPESMHQTGKKAEQSLKQVQVGLNKILKHAVDTQEKQAINGLLEALTRYHPLFDEMLELCVNADAYSASEKYPTLKQHHETLKTKFQNLLLLESKLTRQTIATTVEQTTAMARSAEHSAWAIAATMLLFVGSLMFLLTRWILHPLKQAINFATAISQGDFTARLHLSQRDELGEMVSVLSTMGSQLDALVGQIQLSGIQLYSSVNELASTSRQQESVMNTELDDVNNVLHAITEISELSSGLVGTMERITAMLDETAQRAGNGQGKLTTMKQAMLRMEEGSQSISTRLAIIHEKAGNITSVVTTITKVADQTNLLSLNAAIEAEKAREYGRGFMVVANEIRRLADQTAVATLDIEQMTGEMLEAVASGVQNINQFVAEVHHNVEEVQQVGIQLSEIIKGVQALTPNFDKVNHTVQKQSDNAAQIHHLMQNFTQEIEDNASSLHETNVTIEQLKHTAQALQTEVANLKVS